MKKIDARHFYLSSLFLHHITKVFHLNFNFISKTHTQDLDLISEDCD